MTRVVSDCVIPTDTLFRLRAERDRFIASWERHQNGPAEALGLAVVYLLAELREVLDEPA